MSFDVWRIWRILENLMYTMMDGHSCSMLRIHCPSDHIEACLLYGELFCSASDGSGGRVTRQGVALSCSSEEVSFFSLFIFCIIVVCLCVSCTVFCIIVALPSVSFHV